MTDKTNTDARNAAWQLSKRNWRNKMSKLMDEFREQIHNYTGHGALSRQRIEQVKETIPDVMFCVSCNEELPKGHHIGDRDINGLWEPFCEECFEVTMICRKAALEGNDG